MNDVEKINIRVPKKIGTQLDNDAKLFEILKKDGRTINRNAFLSMLLLGYYNTYSLERQEKSNVILELLKSDLPKEKCKEICEILLKKVVLPVVPSRKGKNPVRLSLKPTKNTESLITSISNEIGVEDSFSQYFCRMLMSYCQKPLPERERIIFKNNYEILSNACKRQRPIMFSTIWNKNAVHIVIPYRLDIGKEELFNYLLCAETNPNTGKQEAKSYRLNRITGINYANIDNRIDNTILYYLDEMSRLGAPYSINDSEISRVQLTEKGLASLKRIYYGRPQDITIRKTENGYDCDIKGSKDQVFQYFRRFGEDAEIISPKELRNRLVEFHQKATEKYT